MDIKDLETKIDKLLILNITETNAFIYDKRILEVEKLKTNLNRWKLSPSDINKHRRNLIINAEL